MKKSVFLLIALCAVQFSQLANAQLPPDSVVDVWFTSPQQIREFREHLDIWGADLSKGSMVVYLPDGDTSLLAASALRWQVNSRRSQKFIDDRQLERSGGNGIDGFSCYRTVEETFLDLSQLAADNPDLAEWVDIGDSWQKTNASQGFDINAMIITNENSGVTDKTRFMVMAAMHAREYATAELVSRFAEMLVNGYDIDPDITWLLDYTEIHIVPQVNPDGRIIAEQPESRFKRKNDDTEECAAGSILEQGVDLNRNNLVFFGGGASSGNECSDLYRGPSAVSEPETQAIQQYLDSIFPDQRDAAPDDFITPVAADSTGLFISVHSFSELILYPWEGIGGNSGNHSALRSLARKLAFFNRQLFDLSEQYVACQDCLGAASGTTPDYAYGELGVAAVTYELGRNFHEDCSSFEDVIAPDNLNSLLFAAKAARRPYLEPQGPEITDIVIEDAVVAINQPVLVTALASDTRRQHTDNDPDNENVFEPVDAIASAIWTLNTPEFSGGLVSSVAASDGSFDSDTENLSFTVPTTGLPIGRYQVFITASDTSGQQGVPSSVFFTVSDDEAFFIDGFEE